MAATVPQTDGDMQTDNRHAGGCRLKGRLVLVAVWALAAFACTDMCLYERFYDVSVEQWGDRVLHYTFHNDDTLTPRSIDMVIATERLPFDDTLHVVFEVFTPDGVRSGGDYRVSLSGDARNMPSEHVVSLVDSARFVCRGNYLMSLRRVGGGERCGIKAVGVAIR